MTQRLDVPRLQRAIKNLYVQGDPDGVVRAKAIEDAIAAIQLDGTKALIDEYIGVKNYSGFGDQREDHLYGNGPRHGNIVFRIARVGTSAEKRAALVLFADEIYLLEAVRDFGLVDGMNLCEALLKRNEFTRQIAPIDEALYAAVVDSHEDNNEVVE